MIGRSIMGQSYSLDLRARIVGHVRAGHSRRDAARHFRVSASCAVKLLKRADRTGSVEPGHRGRPRGSGKLAAHQAFLIGRVEAQPDITMPELARALQAERGVIASPASLSRVLCKAGFTYKKTADGVWSPALMVHSSRWTGRMRYGPSSPWERPHDGGGPSSNTKWSREPESSRPTSRD